MRRHKPAKDDWALRRSYLERYAARDSRLRLTRLNSSMGIDQRTVDAWMRDPEFVAERTAIDQRRLEDALAIGHTAWPTIMEQVCMLAEGVPEEPPPDPGDDWMRKAVLAGYQAREAKRQNLMVRAAELVADVIGARKRQGVEVNLVAREMFGTIPESEAELLADNKRMDAILARAEARQRASRKD